MGKNGHWGRQCGPGGSSAHRCRLSASARTPSPRGGAAPHHEPVPQTGTGNQAVQRHEDPTPGGTTASTPTTTAGAQHSRTAPGAGAGAAKPTVPLKQTTWYDCDLSEQGGVPLRSTTEHPRNRSATTEGKPPLRREPNSPGRAQRRTAVRSTRGTPQEPQCYNRRRPSAARVWAPTPQEGRLPTTPAADGYPKQLLPSV